MHIAVTPSSDPGTKPIKIKPMIDCAANTFLNRLF